MKKVLLSLLLCTLSVPVLAGPERYGSRLVVEPRWQTQHHHHNHWRSHWRHNGGVNWMVPAIIGGAVVYSTTRPEPVVVQQPVVVQTSPVTVQQNCSPWTETQNPDGTITRTRTCAQ
jgi:hypothetical protein